MQKIFCMANFITLLRLLLLFLVIALVQYASPTWQLLTAPLSIVVMLLDVADGMIARARQETSLFGAVFDIATDRIIEISLWVVLLKSNFVSIWIPIIFVVRGVLVDALRKKYSDLGLEPFSIMRTVLGRFCVSSRSMRFLYGMFKLISFAWLLFLLPASVLWSNVYSANLPLISMVSYILIYSTLAICLIRGIPVILETILLQQFKLPK